MRSRRLITHAAGAGLALTAAVSGCAAQPRAVAVLVPNPGQQAQATCIKVIAAMPAELDSGVGHLATNPMSPLVAAWGSRSAPIVVRCGVNIPSSYDPAAQLTAVDVGTGEVAWYVEKRGSVSVLTCIRRPVKVELTLPKKYRPDVILGSVTRVVAELIPPGSDGT